MKRMTIIIISLLAMGILTSLQAQDLKKQMEGLYQTYLHSESVTMDVEMQIYRQHTSTEPGKIQEGRLLKNDHNFYYMWDDISYLQTNESSVLLDHGGKKIIYQTSPKKYEQAFSYRPEQMDELFKQMDDMMAKTDEVEFLGDRNGRKRYKIQQAGQVIETIVIAFDSKSGSLLEMEYYYNTELFSEFNKVKIIYKELSFDKEIDPENFDQSKFITKAGPMIFPAAEYLGYEIINNDEENKKYQ